MPEPRSPFPSKSRQEFVTIRISKTAGLMCLLVLIVILAFVALGLRERANDQVALASATASPQEQAVASPSAVETSPKDAVTPRVAAEPAETKSADPLPMPETQAPVEAAADSPAANQSEAAPVEVQQRQATLLESPVADTATAQPEIKPDDPPSQPAYQPDPPAAPSPAAPDPPPARPAPPISPVTLFGAGATYPYPLYSKWFDDYYKLNPGIQFNYMAVGSGAGVHELLAGTVDFGATDVPTSDEQLSHARTRILNVPTVLGAIVPIYNIPGVSREVLFTPEVLAGIYLGKIVSWSDPTIARVNPAANLPDLPIVVIHRADGDAATFIFTDYLSKVSTDWQKEVGKGTSVNWPIGLGAKGNEGVHGILRHTPGAIGYVDLLYAQQNHLPFASVRNAAGQFVKASLRSVTEAAASVVELPPDSGISITNAPGKEAYPIAGFTWLLVPQRSKDPAKGQDLADFLYWMVGPGQPMAENLGYASLPRKLVPQVKKLIAQVR
jgi:phosphate transport system substrate-binding protein